MDVETNEARWDVWTVQAQRFAQRENFLDAVTRMKLVRDAIREALDEATEPEQRERLELRLARAEELLTTMRAQYTAWRDEIAARRQRTIDQAPEEIAWPLPMPADSR